MRKYTKQGLQARANVREGYAEFFEKHRRTRKRCENCGKQLIGHVCEIAHILPKTVFRSVATNDDAIMHLCCGLFGEDGCHEVYDSTWENAKKMFVWQTALERYQKFKHLITEKNRKILNHFEYGDT